MSELIDRERFSADMRDFQNRVGIWRDEAEDRETWTRADAALATIIETKLILDKQPTIAAPRWHRVEEEEPTKAGWYLVMDEDGDFNVDEWHNTFGWQFVTPSDADRITHWMPIEPPKEDA